MSGRLLLQSQLFKRTVFPVFRQSDPVIHHIDGVRQILSPFPGITFFIPVIHIYRPALKSPSGLIADFIAVFIKDIFLSLLGSPLPVFFHRAQGEHKMEMQVMDAILINRIMDCPVRTHPFGNKIPLHIIPHRFFCQLIAPVIWKCCFQCPAKLGIFLFLIQLHRVPQHCPVQPFLRCIFREIDFTMHQIFMVFRAIRFPVILADKNTPADVRSCIYRRLPFAPLYNAEPCAGIFRAHTHKVPPLP